METVHGEIELGEKRSIRITTLPYTNGVSVRIHAPNRLGDITPTKCGLRIEDSLIDKVIDALRAAQQREE